ncbi:UDP-4-amino-4,6-dideoxy-N-acetyl-beta-L-altrosamine transaminase [Methyloversatilis discipulorum]|uniref:UDP-4-amino-4, 6-dideoxy-N-acetyl-beta-L-altrosamine transaminase n=1 Tax=Methyloversatilis discipulorum TaxID=1119528 RepID=UPI001A5DE149|nr:UDP-4-amino-4,6-dideoxy-N-acetyl-beta-L-altrosamine transaminase [Methyloversatilis discipulorum]MBL8470073.1 UDP-4-amino-4,6-dideoxy-N-acetyl-beta-L-altrosamine transaminase [Methyloversatilis discipulorum]
MSGFIPYGRQQISEEDIEAVVRVLRSDYLTQGPAVPAFEQAVARHCGAAYAVAMNSATSALHVACLALGVGPGDRVWTSPVTFVASANCALYCGATVDFVDVDAATGNMCAARLAAKLEQAERDGTLPRVVIPVHLCGRSCDMKAIRALSRRYGFAVIEDASHAIGARYDGAPVGDCRYSDITVFSFHPVKIITTAEGGMALTQDAALARRMERLRSHGITRDPADMTQAPDGPWYYQQIELGFNYRMTDMQAALGLSQMSRLDAFVARRHEVAARYADALAGLPVDLPPAEPDGRSALHLYVVRVGADLDRRVVFEALRARDIGVNVHYIPVHLQPYYAALGFRPGHCPAAERYYAAAISLPMHPGLSDADHDRVVMALRDALA